jgi:hypothetical protein
MCVLLSLTGSRVLGGRAVLDGGVEVERVEQPQPRQTKAADHKHCTRTHIHTYTTHTHTREGQCYLDRERRVRYDTTRRYRHADRQTLTLSRQSGLLVHGGERSNSGAETERTRLSE